MRTTGLTPGKMPEDSFVATLPETAGSGIAQRVATDLSMQQMSVMARSTGSADLPLHGGRVPQWLGERMTRLGSVISEAIVHHYGRDELLRRLANPFWFQSFGAVMGMDWHSSGITTSVMGALKRGLAPMANELGVHVCGGRGRNSRKTPTELLDVGEKVGLDGAGLAVTSKLVAKVDSAAVQDGFELYLHSFVVTDDGRWTVVQQGMNSDRRQARRYHWLSEGLESFVEDPHAAIEGPGQGRIVNLADERARRARDAQVALLASDPERVVRAIEQWTPHLALDVAEQEPASSEPLEPVSEDGAARRLRLTMPSRHEVHASDVVLRRLRGTIATAQSAPPPDFPSLLLTPGVGGRTVLALAMAAEVIHGTPCRFTDPARFSLALGGKDGHPFPVPLRVYDETIRVLKDAVTAAKRLPGDDRLAAIQRLDRQARWLERGAEGPDFRQFVAEERRRSESLGGRVAVAARPRTSRHTGSRRQRRLPGF